MTKTAVNRDDFDYGQYAPEVQRELQKAAEKIRTAGRDEAEVIIKIGDALSQVKKKVRHGNWGAWLDLEFTMSVSSASRYIRAAAFGKKFVTVTNLSPSMLYLLSAKSTPTPLAQEVLNRAATDEPFSLNEVQQRLVQDKQAKRRVNAPGISETQDSSGPPEPLVQRGADRDGSASTTEPLGEIKRLMATAGDPLEVIKALLRELDDVNTQRFNTWFAGEPAFVRVAA